MSLYPRLMWSPDGIEITVYGAQEEADKLAGGYRLTALAEEPANDPPTYGAADDGTGDEPTEGPADDETHVKRSRKKK